MERESESLTIHVLSGLHEGVVQTVAPGALRIGGGAGADLVLADDGVAPVHIELEFAAGRASFQALHTGVTLGAEDIIPGVPMETSLPAVFSVAGVEFRCEGPAPQPRPYWRRRIVHLPLLTLAAFTAFALLRQGDQPALASVDASAPIEATTVVQRATTLPAAMDPQAAMPTVPPREATAAPPPLVAPDWAATMLQAKLSEAGLAGIKVMAQDRVVVASGLIPPADAPRWQAVREGFDRATGGRVPLRNRVEARVDRPVALHVDSVWTGTFPNIILGGAKYLEGSMLPNGWTLERIGDGRLTLRRGEQQVLVAF